MTNIMKTPQQIIEKCLQSREYDIFGFTLQVLVSYLSFSDAKQFLRDTAKESDWVQLPLDRESVLVEMRAYMQFAWEKAENHRGISAERSVLKMEAWLWLLGDDEQCDLEQYPHKNYGAPKLKRICEFYGWPVPDNPTIEAMVAGKQCPDCISGGMSGCAE